MRIFEGARSKVARTSRAEAGRDSEAQVASVQEAQADRDSEAAGRESEAVGGKPERFRVWAAVPAATSEPTAVAGRRVDRAWALARAEEEEVALRAGPLAEVEPAGAAAEAAEAEGAGDDDHQGGGIHHA